MNSSRDFMMTFSWFTFSLSVLYQHRWVSRSRYCENVSAYRLLNMQACSPAWNRDCSQCWSLNTLRTRSLNRHWRTRWTARFQKPSECFYRSNGKCANLLFKNCVITNFSSRSLLPAKTCWELMSRVMKGPQSMALYKGRGKSQSGWNCFYSSLHPQTSLSDQLFYYYHSCLSCW